MVGTVTGRTFHRHKDLTFAHRKESPLRGLPQSDTVAKECFISGLKRIIHDCTSFGRAFVAQGVNQARQNRQ